MCLQIEQNLLLYSSHHQFPYSEEHYTLLQQPIAIPFTLMNICYDFYLRLYTLTPLDIFYSYTVLYNLTSSCINFLLLLTIMAPKIMNCANTSFKIYITDPTHCVQRTSHQQLIWYKYAFIIQVNGHVSFILHYHSRTFIALTSSSYSDVMSNYPSSLQTFKNIQIN